MLNKQETPTFDDLICYCGDSGKLWIALDKYLKDEFDATALIRFPYGKEYGWSVKYSRKNKHICDVFAESGAFAAFFQVSTNAVESVYDKLDSYSKGVWENKYPCTSGGWIDFRVLNDENLQNLKKIIHAKVRSK